VDFVINLYNYLLRYELVASDVVRLYLVMLPRMN
jgi:hypothetical protein